MTDIAADTDRRDALAALALVRAIATALEQLRDAFTERTSRMPTVTIARCPHCSGVQAAVHVHRLWCTKDADPVTVEEQWPHGNAVEAVEAALSGCACADLHPDLCAVHGSTHVRAVVAVSAAANFLTLTNYGPNPMPDPRTIDN